MKHLPSILFGLVLGIVLVLACGDDSPDPADAADASVCDCPAAEAPIGPRIVVVKLEVTIPAMGFISNAVPCPAGSTLITGSCELRASPQDVVLASSGFFDAGNNDWGCMWTNNDVIPRNANILAKCLVP